MFLVENIIIPQGDEGMDKQTLMRTIGNNIRNHRKLRGLTQEQLAEKAGISTSFCANIERGNKGISLFVLKDISDILEVSVDLGRRRDNDYDYISVDFTDATNYAAVWVNEAGSDSFDGEYYTDDDNTMLLGVYNNTDEDLSSVKVCDQDEGGTIQSIGSLDDGDYYYLELNTKDYPDIYVRWSGNSDDEDFDDMDNEVPFAVINLEDADGGDANLDSIDDLA